MEKQSFTYAGIGSRETPNDILALMTTLATKLDTLGYTLHSGGADGADTAFERGAKNKRIFLPWENFNGNKSTLHTIPDIAFQTAEQFHPAWDMCSRGARKLHARNCQQVLGADLKQPVDFVLCWHLNSGGTMQAVRIAGHYNIPVVNLADENWAETLNTIVPDLE